MIHRQHLSGNAGGIVRSKERNGICLILNGALGNPIQRHMTVAQGGKVGIKGGNLLGGVQRRGGGARQTTFTRMFPAANSRATFLLMPMTAVFAVV